MLDRAPRRRHSPLGGAFADLDSWRPLPPELVQPRKAPRRAHRGPPPRPCRARICSSFEGSPLTPTYVWPGVTRPRHHPRLPRPPCAALSRRCCWSWPPRAIWSAPESSRLASPDGWTPGRPLGGGQALGHPRRRPPRAARCRPHPLGPTHSLRRCPRGPLRPLPRADRRRGRPPASTRTFVVTQILAGLRYNDPRLFSILGGKRA